MSRSGYIDDCDDILAFGRWRAQVKARGIAVAEVDVEDPEQVADLVGIARQLAAEIEYLNDEEGERYERIPSTRAWRRVEETPEERWVRMRKWVAANIIGVANE